MPAPRTSRRASLPVIVESHALAFLVGEVCRGAYVQVPFTSNAAAGAAPAIHGFAAPLWTAASGCPGPPSS